MKSQWRIWPRVLLIVTILSSFLLPFSTKISRAQEDSPQFREYEILLRNETSGAVEVIVSAVGMIFNESDENAITASGRIVPAVQGQPITGDVVTILAIPGDQGVVNHAFTSNPGVNRHICYGKYLMSVSGVGFYVDFLILIILTHMVVMLEVVN